MAVGNLVVGDSRVEKAAITARDLGYKVTVVGIRRRTVQQVSFIDGDIPIIRPPVGNEHHSGVVDAIAKRDERLVNRRRQINGLPQSLKRPAYLAHRSVVRSRALGIRASRRLGRSWRTLWPHLVDYEDTFFDAFKALQPDVLHIHDRHPLPGAAKYARWAEQNCEARPVKWVYDAHEFVPTQHLPPPVEHQQAWIAVESECIQRADAVVTVTNKIAELIRRRHGLDRVPQVVRNLPSLDQAAHNTLRTDVRSTIGLDPDAPLAVYAGGITLQRGLGTLLDAQQLLPELHVAVICKNDKDQRRTLRKQAEKLGTESRLHLLDYVPASHVSRFISTADVGISALLPSPAHQEAAPTKVSEYLHAHLPVVVSDMRAQAERVKRIGFGAVYPSGDSRGMAEALAHVLENSSQFTEKITDSIIHDNSWEADAPALAEVWQELSPDDRQLQPAIKTEPYVSILRNTSEVQQAWGGAIEELRKTMEVRFSLPLLKGIQGDLTDGGFVLSDDGLRFLEFWRREVAQVRAVLYDEPITLVEGWDPALTTGILAMSGKPAIRALENVEVFEIDSLRERFPHHWVHEISGHEEVEIRDEFVHLRDSIRAVDRGVVTNSMVTSWALGGISTYVPSPVPTADLPYRSASELRIGWAKNLRRSEKERSSLDSLKSDMSIRGLLAETCVLDGPPKIAEVDIFIDTLSTDLLTDDACRALGAGCVVITGKAETEWGEGGMNSIAQFLTEAPVVFSEPTKLTETVLSLATDRTILNELGRATHDYALRRLSAGAIADRLSEALH